MWLLLYPWERKETNIREIATLFLNLTTSILFRDHHFMHK